RRLTGGLGAGFAAALLGGAIALPEAFGWLLGPAAFGNPLVLSTALPLLGVAVLYGVARLRPALSGLAFGVAGALLFAALAYVADVRFVPDFLDRAWLLGNAALAAVIGAGTMRKDA